MLVLSKTIMERTGEKVGYKLYTARPGIIIGKKGAEIEILKQDLDKLDERNDDLTSRRCVGRKRMPSWLLSPLPPNSRVVWLFAAQ